jgi:hypothetical protein
MAADYVSREDRAQAIHAASDAAADGMELASDIVEHNHEPWRWQYPNVYLSDDAACSCSRVAFSQAIRSRRLLKLEP